MEFVTISGDLSLFSSCDTFLPIPCAGLRKVVIARSESEIHVQRKQVQMRAMCSGVARVPSAVNGPAPD